MPVSSTTLLLPLAVLEFGKSGLARALGARVDEDVEIKDLGLTHEVSGLVRVQLELLGEDTESWSKDLRRLELGIKNSMRSEVHDGLTLLAERLKKVGDLRYSWAAANVKANLMGQWKEKKEIFKNEDPRKIPFLLSEAKERLERRLGHSVYQMGPSTRAAPSVPIYPAMPPSLSAQMDDAKRKKEEAKRAIDTAVVKLRAAPAHVANVEDAKRLYQSVTTEAVRKNHKKILEAAEAAKQLRQYADSDPDLFLSEHVRALWEAGLNNEDATEAISILRRKNTTLMT